MKKQWVIAIDGPSGSGKSTCAKLLAKELGLLYIDTGAMYRALGLWAQMNQVPFDDHEKINELLQNINLKYGVNESTLIEIDGQNLTEKIREHEVSKLASIISQIPSVREYLVNFQRTLATTKVCVMEGRDIGSVVFPEAFCKFFITTASELRANRRLAELDEKGETLVHINISSETENHKFKLKSPRYIDRKSINILRNKEISLNID